VDRYTANLLLTMNDEHPDPITCGVVDVENDTVVWVGPEADAPQVPIVNRIRIPGLLMPGLVNAHCHTPMVLLRGAGENLPTDRWLREVMWPREARMTPDDVRLGMQLGATEMLANGITTSVEMYFHPDAVAEGAVEAGIRCLVTYPVFDTGPPHDTPLHEQLDDMVSALHRWHATPTIDIGLGPHAVYTVSERGLRAVADVARAEGVLVHIHVAEGEGEDADERARSGMGVPELLEKVGILENRTLAAHVVWMTDDDIELFARHNVGVAHCPCSNAKHASGVARVEDMRAAGIDVGLGTDGPASHHRLDLFEEMRTASRLARIHFRDASRIPSSAALTMATTGAADALGRPDLGRLGPGSKADMIAINTSAPELGPDFSSSNAVSRLVWSASPSVVDRVWVGGRLVVDQGCVTSTDVGELSARVSDIARRISQA